MKSIIRLFALGALISMQVVAVADDYSKATEINNIEQQKERIGLEITRVKELGDEANEFRLQTLYDLVSIRLSTLIANDHEDASLKSLQAQVEYLKKKMQELDNSHEQSKLDLLNRYYSETTNLIVKVENMSNKSLERDVRRRQYEMGVQDNQTATGRIPSEEH